MNINDLYNAINNEDKDIEQKVDININNNDKDLKCINCNTNTLVFYDGGTFCNICGLLQDVKFTNEQEYRYYGENDNKSSDPTRVGMPINNLLPKSSMGTMIANNVGYDVYTINRIRQFHSWNTMPYQERSLWKDYEIISNKANKLGLSVMIIEEAKKYYKTIREESLNRGSNRKALEAACIYFACKSQNVPRSTREISKEFNLNIKDMSKGIKKFNEIINRINIDNKYNIISTTITPLDFINRYCSKLKLNNDIKNLSEYVILKSLNKKIVEENTPSSISSSCIYFVCMITNQNITKQDISNICNVSEVTIGKCYKKLYEYRNLLLPLSAIEKYKIKL